MTITQNELYDAIEVIAPSGAVFPVLNEDEREYFEDVAQRYLSDNHFSNVTDLQDLDRIIHMEMLCQRWNSWISRESDYNGDAIDQEKHIKYVNEFSKEIRLLKKQLGVDKSSRDKDKGESVAKFVDDLKIRAREFGIMRNEQAVTAITLFKQLESLVVLSGNCTPEERRENKDIKAEVDDIFDWLVTIAIPEMNEIDLNFREHQKLWIRDM